MSKKKTMVHHIKLWASKQFVINKVCRGVWAVQKTSFSAIYSFSSYYYFFQLQDFTRTKLLKDFAYAMILSVTLVSGQLGMM